MRALTIKEKGEKLMDESMPIPETGCRIAMCAVDRSNGYAMTCAEGKPIRAHRLSYLCFRGDIPAGLSVLHKCDTRTCINPEHLWIGTHRDNTQDMLRKGRGGHLCGERASRAKLNARQVVEIRKRYGEGESQAELSRAFRVSGPSIHGIVNGIYWKHL